MFVLVLRVRFHDNTTNDINSNNRPYISIQSKLSTHATSRGRLEIVQQYFSAGEEALRRQTQLKTHVIFPSTTKTSESKEASSLTTRPPRISSCRS